MSHRKDSGGTILLVIDGPAPGKPRMTQRDKWKKRPNVLAYRAWCDRVRAVAGKLPEAGRVTYLGWIAYYTPPPSWSQKKQQAAIGQPHRAKPDRDNVDKAVLDTLYKGTDSAIAIGTIEKRWATVARIEIVIEFERN